MKKLTLEEVGRLAGVSRATVSRVVNNTGNVDPELRARVEAVIRETGYRPHAIARSLASNRTNIIGLIIPKVAHTLFTDPFYPTLIQGISQACNNNHLTLALFVYHSQQEEEQVFERAVNTGILDGLIVHERLTEPFIDELIGRELPFVHVGRPRNGAQVNYVDVDNVVGMLLAVKHLIRMGHRRIGYVGAPLHQIVGVDRREGYLLAHHESQLPINDDLMAYGDFSQASGYEAMRRLLAHQPDAVCAASDTMALGALQAIREAGLRVPEDMAVVSFDDLPPALSADPPLTTVRQSVERTGRVAVETLIDVLNTGPTPPRRIVLPVELVIRESCGALSHPITR